MPSTSVQVLSPTFDLYCNCVRRGEVTRNCLPLWGNCLCVSARGECQKALSRGGRGMVNPSTLFHQRRRRRRHRHRGKSSTYRSAPADQPTGRCPATGESIWPTRGKEGYFFIYHPHYPQHSGALGGARPLSLRVPPGFRHEAPTDPPTGR